MGSTILNGPPSNLMLTHSALLFFDGPLSLSTGNRDGVLILRRLTVQAGGVRHRLTVSELGLGVCRCRGIAIDVGLPAELMNG